MLSLIVICFGGHRRRRCVFRKRTTGVAGVQYHDYTTPSPQITPNLAVADARSYLRYSFTLPAHPLHTRLLASPSVPTRSLSLYPPPSPILYTSPSSQKTPLPRRACSRYVRRTPLDPPNVTAAYSLVSVVVRNDDERPSSLGHNSHHLHLPLVAKHALPRRTGSRYVQRTLLNPPNASNAYSLASGVVRNDDERPFLLGHLASFLAGDALITLAGPLLSFPAKHLHT